MPTQPPGLNLPVDYLAGLDLGQGAEPTALAVVERTRSADPEKPHQTVRRYAVRYLKRWPLQTAFEDIARDVAGLLAMLDPRRPLLAVDQTGVWLAVVGTVRRADIPASLYPVTITFGAAVTPPGEDGSLHVPKKDLAGVLSVLLQGHQLQFAPLPESELLKRELLQFRVKPPSAGAVTVESWRERPHDDLVLAVGLACWLGERFQDFEAPSSIPNPPQYRTGQDRLDPFLNRGNQERLDPYRNRRPGGNPENPYR
jgi:hypothetical protein